MCLCMKSARYLLTYLHCCLFLTILIILFVPFYILLHILMLFLLPAAMLLFYVKHFELFCTWNVLQINVTLYFMCMNQDELSVPFIVIVLLFCFITFLKCFDESINKGKRETHNPVSSWPNMPVVGLWEEAGENPNQVCLFLLQVEATKDLKHRSKNYNPPLIQKHSGLSIKNHLQVQ